jgi:hypothetical protein
MNGAPRTIQSPKGDGDSSYQTFNIEPQALGRMCFLVACGALRTEVNIARVDVYPW